MEKVLDKMSNEYLTLKIKHYQKFACENKISSAGLGRVLRIIYDLRKTIYAKNINTNNKVIIDDAVMFVSFQERLLIKPMCRANTARTLELMCKDYSNLINIDGDSVLYDKYVSTLLRLKQNSSKFGYKKWAINEALKKIENIKYNYTDKNVCK